MQHKITSLRKRPAHQFDAVHVVSWFHNRSEAISWGGRDVAEPLTPTWLAQQFETGTYWVWVDQEDRIVGVFGFVFPKEGQVHLTRFAIRPDLRGQGFAKPLVEEIAKFARSFGAKGLSLGVYGSNHIARHVYNSLGFQVISHGVAEEDTSGISVRMNLDL